MAIHVSARLDRSKIDKTKDYEGFLMVSMEADEDPNRTPVCVGLVIDISGSMQDQIETGESKLEAVKKTAKRIIKNLSANDELSVVLFYENAEVLIPRTKVVDKDSMISKIDTLGVKDWTNLSAGLLLGLDQLKAEFRGVKRLMLLSDGEANQGVVEVPELIKMAKNASGIPISTFSYGIRTNKELMGALAQATDGNHAYVQGGDVKDTFARELGGMLSCIGQSISVKVVPNRGNRILDLLNSFEMKRDEDSVTVSATDIYAGEKKHLVFRVSLKIPEKPKDRDFSVAKVQFSCMDPKSAERKEFEFNPKVAYESPDKSDGEPVLEVAEQVAVLLAAKAQQEAVTVRDKGDVKKMNSILDEARERLVHSQKRGSSLCDAALLIHDFVAIAMKECYDAQVGSMVANAAYNATRGRAGSTGCSGYSGTVGCSGFSGLAGRTGFSGVSGFSGYAGLYNNKLQDALSKKFLADDEDDKKTTTG